MADRFYFYAGLRALALGLLVLGGTMTLTAKPAASAAAMNAAVANANSGLNACASFAKKALYDCVANVLDRMSNEISVANIPATSAALQTAASGLRSATTRVQALSAINTCRSAIGAALQQIKALAGKPLPGWGGSGIAAISAVVNRAAQLIQSKG